MSKILIIGNGPSALKNKYGELIDSDKWDVVMRFNRWDKNDDGTKHNDYSEYNFTHFFIYAVLQGVSHLVY